MAADRVKVLAQQAASQSTRAERHGRAVAAVACPACMQDASARGVGLDRPLDAVSGVDTSVAVMTPDGDWRAVYVAASSCSSTQKPP